MLLERITRFALDRPRLVIGLAIIGTLLFALQFPRIHIDTDPENMLSAREPDRVFYDKVKKDFGIHDLIVVGIEDKQGIFRPEALARVSQATSDILKIDGVIAEDIVSLTTTDNIKSSGGLVDIHPTLDMKKIPRTVREAEKLREDIADNPFLAEKIASRDGKATALYVPITRKDMSFRIAREIKAILKRNLLPGQAYYLAGLPVAEDTFGHEMFVQMAVVAPLAFGVILLLVFLMFRKIAFLLPIGMDAMFAVVWAMGLLIGTGHTVHIMSSMIPVFLMPIAITDDIHILSGFFDRFRETGDKRGALIECMAPLYRPMLYTSLTSAVGFASLALADIPPVRVFGLFVAFGIMAAWLFSMTVVPAVVSLMSDEKLKKLAIPAPEKSPTLLDQILRSMGKFAFSRARIVLLVGLVVLVIGVVGILRIEVNDNPVRWFKAGHPIRVADEIMNRLFGGTYMAYLVVEGERAEIMKEPEVVSYLARLQSHLEADPLVGKTSSIADIVKRINLVLHNNEPAYDAVPNSAEAIGQFLFLFQSSGDPDELDNFLDYDSRKAAIWVQLKGGDNKNMAHVEQRLEQFVSANPLPSGIALRWSGLTYINKVWQNLMVVGMLKAVLGSFVVVFLLMAVEFRSIFMGLLSMVPLTLAILLSYGLVGWIGKDYDMPIAVCSCLALGLAVDYAIHYLQRFKAHYEISKSLAETNDYMFGEPGRAILRNAIVISVGFLPLVGATLTPYVTVGIFFALLMTFSALATFFVLPAAMRLVGPRLLSGVRRMKSLWLFVPLLGLGILASSSLEAAETTDGRAVMNESILAYYYPEKDARGEVFMKITNRQGQIRKRRLTMLRLDQAEGGEQSYFIYFHEPADVQGMSFLVLKHPGKDDDRWLYLPALDLVKRIATSDKRTSFAGSDFTYEDVSGRDLDEDSHELVGEETVGEHTAYVVKSTPKRPGEVEFSSRKFWIDKVTHLPLKVEHYDLQGKLYKVYETQEIQTIQGIPTITKATMRDLANERVTEVTSQAISYDIGLSSNTFQERSLRRPPSQWIR